MEIKWADGFSIRVSAEDNTAVISANGQGLLSLAWMLLDLAGEAAGAHIHLDAYNSLEEGSAELILEKTN